MIGTLMRGSMLRWGVLERHTPLSTAGKAVWLDFYMSRSALNTHRHLMRGSMLRWGGS